MKKSILVCLGITGLAALATAVATPFLPAAAIGAVSAAVLTTGFFTTMLGFGVVLYGNHVRDVSLDTGRGAVASMVAGAIAMTAVNLSENGPAQAATPQARHAFAESTTRPCPRPGQGDFIPLTDNCRAQARTASQG